MRFIMLLKSDQNAEAGVMPDEAILGAMGRYNDELIQADALLAGEGLHPSSKGFRVRNAGGTLTVTDGPFAEAKELVAGFWMIQADSKEEAIEWAQRVPMDIQSPLIPSDAEGQIEIRQVFEMEDFPVSEGESGWREQETAFREQSRNAARSGAAGESATIRFMLMTKATQESEAGALPDEKVLAEMGACLADMVENGVLAEAEGLHPSSKGARVYFSGGKRTVVDGPFAETKELIAGYTIIQVNSREEAIEWARRCAMIGGEGEIEGRQVFSESDFPSDLVEKMPEVFEAEREFRERSGR